jgi:ubiquinone/menaquinone biosynthesis C-methylase UbiE
LKPSPKKEVCDMYDSTADSYANMMDKEIDLPVYADVLGRLHERLAKVKGILIDTACGSGHMLSMYHDYFDQSRPLVGIDLSPRMVSIANERLGKRGQVVVGDMCELRSVESGSAAAVLNFSLYIT